MFLRLAARQSQCLLKSSLPAVHMSEVIWKRHLGKCSSSRSPISHTLSHFGSRPVEPHRQLRNFWVRKIPLQYVKKILEEFFFPLGTPVRNQLFFFFRKKKAYSTVWFALSSEPRNPITWEEKLHPIEETRSIQGFICLQTWPCVLGQLTYFIQVRYDTLKKKMWRMSAKGQLAFTFFFFFF